MQKKVDFGKEGDKIKTVDQNAVVPSTGVLFPPTVHSWSSHIVENRHKEMVLH